MRTLMAFGDSLTWGTNVRAGGRHHFNDRWPNVLQEGLGEDYHVVSEGSSGRTTVFDDHSSAFECNGSRALPMLLATHSPLDLVIIMLGANDLKAQICPTAHGAIAGMARLVEIIGCFPYAWNMAPPKIFIISPPHFCNRANGEGPMSGRRLDESRMLSEGYRQIAAAKGCGFFDAATVAKADDIDGVHLDALNSRAIGTALIEPIRHHLNAVIPGVAGS